MSERSDQLQEIAQAFLDAERAGLKIAIKGRLIALALLGFLLISTHSIDSTRVPDFSLALVAFGAIGIVHFFLIGSRLDRPWLKYLFITIDIAALSTLVATQPVLESIDLPQVLVFRNNVFPFYFIILGVAAFSFSPGLVLWSGAAGVAGWLGAFAWVIRDMPVKLDWEDIGPAPNSAEFSQVFFNPNFIGTDSRIQEALAYFVVAILIAAVMWRARRTVYQQLLADAERREVTRIFGQYVPREVADALIVDRGLLAPVERTGQRSLCGYRRVHQTDRINRSARDRRYAQRLFRPGGRGDLGTPWCRHAVSWRRTDGDLQSAAGG